MFATDEILWYDNGRWGQCGYAIANPNGKIWTSNSVMSIFRRAALALIGGRYPAGFSGGEDLTFNRLLVQAGRPPRGELVPTDEMFYVYRWGTGSRHLSGVSDGTVRPHQAHWDALGRLPIERGTFTIRPHWRRDYAALAIESTASVHAGAQGVNV
jgi:hypothetical protein